MGCKKMPSKSKPDFVSHTSIQTTVCSNLVNALMKHSQAGDSLLSASTKQPICNNIIKTITMMMIIMIVIIPLPSS